MGNTALLRASDSRNGSGEVIRALVAAGADVNVKNMVNAHIHGGLITENAPPPSRQWAQQPS